MVRSRGTRRWDHAWEVATPRLIRNPASPIDKAPEFSGDTLPQKEAACYKISDVIKIRDLEDYQSHDPLSEHSDLFHKTVFA